MEIKSIHLKGMSSVTNFLSKPVYVKFQSIQLDLQSLRSFYSFYLAKLYKREMQNTISSYREDEIWDYLVDNYNLEDLSCLKSRSQSKYLLSDKRVVMYAKYMTINMQLKADLELLQRTLEYKENIEAIEELLSTIKENTRPRNISPAGHVKDGHISYRPKYDISKVGILEAGSKRKVLSYSIHEVYYSHLNKLFSDIIPKDEYSTWSFFRDKSRAMTAPFLQGVLDGNICATSRLGRKVQDAYILMQRHRGKNFIFEESLADRLRYLEQTYKTISVNNNFEVLGIDDYNLYYSKNKPLTTKRTKYEVEILTGYYVYDYDKQELMPTINRLLGITGEFSRENRSNAKYPTMLYNAEGDLVEMYRVEDVYDIADDMLEEQPNTHRSLLGLVNTLYKADNLSTNLSELLHKETKKFATQADIYYQYAVEYASEQREFAKQAKAAQADAN